VTEARCAVHPEAASTFACERCGRFGCGACAAGAGLCSECFMRVSVRPASAMAKVGLALGLLGTVTLVPGVAALAIGLAEQRRIAEGRAPPSGLPLARGAVILGGLCCAALGAIALWALQRALGV
jgi:hypothetical protein